MAQINLLFRKQFCNRFEKIMQIPFPFSVAGKSILLNVSLSKQVVRPTVGSLNLAESQSHLPAIERVFPRWFTFIAGKVARVAVADIVLSRSVDNF